VIRLPPQPVSPGRVVVIGASGFVGRDLVRHLGELGVPTLPLASRDLDLLRPESRDALRQTVRADDAVVLISALTPDRGRDIATLMRNLTMAENFCAALEASGCAHLTYVSSDAVYEDDANPVRETSCCNPSTFHGLMHLARERMLAYAAGKAKTPLLVLRPCAVYGPGDTHNSYGPNRFLRTARAEGKITLFGNGEEKRDHLYVRDLSRLTGLCLRHRAEGTLNVATGRAASFHDVAEEVARVVPGPVEVVGLPRTTPVTHRHFDVTATLQAFPQFRFTPLAEGLAETVAAPG